MKEKYEEKSSSNAIQWMNNNRFGMFIHWGVYSLLERCEWAMMHEERPREEYEKLADHFIGDKFDANAIAALAKKAGMTHMCMTTKHHDGFCLFDSELTDYTSVKCAAKRDFISEFTTACRNAGLRVGLYYSLMDWHHPDWHALKRGDKTGHERFLAYIHGQLRELMTNYGEIDLLFYDIPAPYEKPEEWKAKEMNAMVKELQPGILVNDRNRLPGDFTTPEQHIKAGPVGRAWQSCMTLNDGWAFSRGDDQWKSPKQVARLLQRIACQNGSLLLNIGPKADGTVPPETVEILTAVGGWLERNGESILSPDQSRHVIICTVGGHTIANGVAYIHAQSYISPEIGVGKILSKVKRVTILATGQEVKFEQTGTRLRLLDLPPEAPDPVVTVFKIEVEGELKIRDYLWPSYLTGLEDNPVGVDTIPSVNKLI